MRSLTSTRVFAPFVAFVCFVAWRYYLAPLQDGIRSKEARLSELRSVLDRSWNPEPRQRPTAVVDWPESQGPVLANQGDATDVLRRIALLARNAELVVRRFSPQSALVKNDHIELPYKLQIQGSYANLKAFLDRVSGVRPVVKVTEVAVRRGDQSEQDVPLLAECALTLFALRDETGTGVPVVTPKTPQVSAVTRVALQSDRDPFAVQQRGDRTALASDVKGVSALRIQEVAFTGTMKLRDRYVAIIQAPDKRTFVVNEGETLLDGTVKAVAADTITFSRAAQRDVVQRLRAHPRRTE